MPAEEQGLGLPWRGHPGLADPALSFPSSSHGFEYQDKCRKPHKRSHQETTRDSLYIHATLVLVRTTKYPCFMWRLPCSRIEPIWSSTHPKVYIMNIVSLALKLEGSRSAMMKRNSTKSIIKWHISKKFLVRGTISRY